MYRTGDKLKIHKIHTQVKYNSNKQTQSAAKQNYPASVAFLRHSARKRGGLILQRSRAHTGHCFNSKTSAVWNVFYFLQLYSLSLLKLQQLFTRAAKISSFSSSSIHLFRDDVGGVINSVGHVTGNGWRPFCRSTTPRALRTRVSINERLTKPRTISEVRSHISNDGKRLSRTNHAQQYSSEKCQNNSHAIFIYNFCLCLFYVSWTYTIWW